MITNKDFFETHHLKISETCKALGSPARIAVLEQVTAKENCVEKEMVHVPGLVPTTVLTHLQALKKAGLIKGKVTSGKGLCYCINRKALEEFKQLFDALYEKVISHDEKVIENQGNCLLSHTDSK